MGEYSVGLIVITNKKREGCITLFQCGKREFHWTDSAFMRLGFRCLSLTWMRSIGVS